MVNVSEIGMFQVLLVVASVTAAVYAYPQPQHDDHHGHHYDYYVSGILINKEVSIRKLTFQTKFGFKTLN